jgi:hypothetical protein
MHAAWSFLPLRLGATVLGCVVVMLVAGYAGTAGVLRMRPAGLLRNQ